MRHPLAAANNLAAGIASPANPPIEQPIPEGTIINVGIEGAN